VTTSSSLFPQMRAGRVTERLLERCKDILLHHFFSLFLSLMLILLSSLSSFRPSPSNSFFSHLLFRLFLLLHGKCASFSHSGGRVKTRYPEFLLPRSLLTPSVLCESSARVSRETGERGTETGAIGQHVMTSLSQERQKET